MGVDWYDDAIIIDGLNPSRFGRRIFEWMREGGLTVVHVTHCSPYARMVETMQSLAQWKRWFFDHADLILQVYTVDDIQRAKRAGKTGIILGWQDATGFDDHLYNIALYKELGVGIVQLTYNTANGIGFGCFDSRDGGLTDFGREVVEEMNRVGIAVDLSHCSSQTAADTIRIAKRPPLYSHIAPHALHAFERNKTDREIRAMADAGGHIGVSLHPPFQRKGNDSTLEDFIALIEYVINLAGEDQVGIGTDFVQGIVPSAEWWERAIRDKYHARILTNQPYEPLRYPPDLSGIQDFRNIAIGMDRRGWPEARMRKVMGENFTRYLRRVWDV